MNTSTRVGLLSFGRTNARIYAAHVCWNRVPPPTKNDRRCWQVKKETLF